MASELGARIGQGAFADVHVWAPGQVVKLFRAGFPKLSIQHEARVTRALHAAGAPCAEVFEEMTLDDRCGFVMSHLEGPTLLQLSRSGEVPHHETGAILAGLALAVHQIPPPREIPTLQVYMRAALKMPLGKVPGLVPSDLIAYVDALPREDGLCHVDLHPGNVIMTPEGPRLVDWGGAVRAPAAYDLAVCQVLLWELIPEMVEDPQRPRSVHEALRSEYGHRSGLSATAMTQAVEPFLPVVRLHALLSGAWPKQRDYLSRAVETMATRSGSQGGL